MAQRNWLRSAAAATLGLAIAGCSSGLHGRQPAVAPARAAIPPLVDVVLPAPTPQAADPAAEPRATAARHFTTGQQELAIGHLDRARTEFDLAIEVLLGFPAGARMDPALCELFDRLVDQISTYEILALAEGDGFAEKPYEPASIDQLLALSTFEHPAPSAALRDIVAADLMSTTHDISIPLNDRVLSYIDLFQGRLRDWFQAGLERGGRYLPMIQGVLRAEGLPLDLAYVPLIESAFNPNALSRARAKGVWQFIRTTALEHGLKHDWYVDERADPRKATVAAAKYLRTLNTLFGGDWHLALASYNCGPGTIQRALARTKAAGLWGLVERPRLLPRETREYVPMILAAIVIARNPAQYGFDLHAKPPIAHDTVALTRPVDLRRIAEWTGTSIDEIRMLNPELRRWTTPVRSPEYDLKIPEGSAATLEARLREATAEEMTSLKWYVVKRGETLSAIANKLRVARADLAEANYLSARSVVIQGQELIIPVAPTALLAARTDRAIPVTASHPLAPPADLVAQAPGSAPSDRVKLTYSVRPGDTLSSIARAFRTTVASLMQWNHLPGSRINARDRLTIYASRASGPRS